MGDRDIPSVPVTTLAGLTSPSDLLSELPVSDSLNNAAPLNKSLLFHTLVANESNNLLSVRDENLVRQLVNAIEQTNSDNIELKPQYAIQQHGTNISTYPELLQGIYNFRPTVFNTPQRNATANAQTQQQQYNMQQTVVPNVVQQNVLNEHQATHNSNAQTQQQQLNSNPSVPLQQQLETQAQTSVPLSANISPTMNQSNDQTEPSIRRSRRNIEQIPEQGVDQLQAQQNALQAQQQQQLLLQQQQQQQLHIQQQQQMQQQQQLQLQQQQFHQQQVQTQIAQQTSVIQQPQQQQYQYQQQQQQQQIQKTTVIQPHELSQPLPPQQHIEPSAILVNQNAKTHNQTQNPQQQAQMPHPEQMFQPYIQNSPVQQATAPSTTTTTIQGNFQNVLLLQRQQIAQHRQQQQQPLNKITSNQSPAQAAIAPDAPHLQQIASTSTTSLNHNNINIFGCGVANDTQTNANLSATASSSNSSSGKSQVRSPELANKMGLLEHQQEDAAVQQPNSVSCQNVADTNTSMSGSTAAVDMFTMIKADEKRSGVKRKMAVSIDNIPPEQIY